MSERRRPSLIFRFAGLATLAMLAIMALLYGYVVPRPEAKDKRAEPLPEDTDDASWAQARAFAAAHPDTRLLVCDWPVDLPRGGSVDLPPPDAPAFWDDGKLVQVVQTADDGGLVRGADGDVRAWVAWADGGCTVIRPQTVRVRGRVVDAQGMDRAGATVRGCGAEATSDTDGAFELVIRREALETARADEQGRPRCVLTAGEAETAVLLDTGGVRSVVVQ